MSVCSIDIIVGMNIKFAFRHMNNSVGCRAHANTHMSCIRTEGHSKECGLCCEAIKDSILPTYWKSKRSVDCSVCLVYQTKAKEEMEEKEVAAKYVILGQKATTSYRPMHWHSTAIKKIIVFGMTFQPPATPKSRISSWSYVFYVASDRTTLRLCLTIK